MKIGDVEKIVVSKGKKTTEVIYKTYTHNYKGKKKFRSKTKHEKQPA